MSGVMRTLAVTGGIGSGKSLVCSFLAERGFPVYDADSRTKALYSVMQTRWRFWKVSSIRLYCMILRTGRELPG